MTHQEFFCERDPKAFPLWQEAIVGIAGAGGLGSNIAMLLARAGVGKLIVSDYDQVTVSNLNRQAFNLDQVGLAKVDALEQNIHRINPYIDLEMHNLRLDEENIPGIYHSVDIMIEAFDTASAKAQTAALLNDLRDILCRLNINGLEILLFGSYADLMKEPRDVDPILMVSPGVSLEDGREIIVQFGDAEKSISNLLKAKGYGDVEFHDLNPAARGNYFRLWQKREFFVRNKTLWLVGIQYIQGYRWQGERIKKDIEGAIKDASSGSSPASSQKSNNAFEKCFYILKIIYVPVIFTIAMIFFRYEYIALTAGSFFLALLVKGAIGAITGFIGEYVGQSIKRERNWKKIGYWALARLVLTGGLTYSIFYPLVNAITGSAAIKVILDLGPIQMFTYLMIIAGNWIESMPVRTIKSG
jgi:thiamine biosynthesis protein ThiF family 2